ncbi:MAG: hypothetical protein ACI3VB_03215 [Oscillospiraceae bacterium]
MNKKSVLWIILDLIFLVVFNVCFFVIGGTDHPASVWISYACIHLAYILLIITPFLVRSGTSKAVFGFALTSISSAYFLLEFIVGIVFILVRSESYKTALVVQVIIAGIYAIMLVSHMIANETTADSEAEHEYDLIFVKTCSSKLKGIVDGISDKPLRKKVERAYDAVHSSPVKSNNSVRPLEQQIDSLIDGLSSDISFGNSEAAGNKADRIVSLADERTRQLKLSN